MRSSLENNYICVCVCFKKKISYYIKVKNNLIDQKKKKDKLTNI